FLATVVQTQGSTYRKTGARMLIAGSGEIAGMVSGGCLEQDILCHVQQQTPPYQPFVITYDTTTEGDLLWGFGIGCDGVVSVLVEHLVVRVGVASACAEASLEENRSHNPLTFIAECFDREQSGVVVTVFQVTGSSSVPIGARLMLHSDGEIVSNIEDVELSTQIAADAQIALQQQTTIHRQYCLQLGQADVSIEVIQPVPHLTIFGAGRDVLPLAQFAKALGWQLTIVDCRSLETTSDRFPMVDRIILARRETIDLQVKISPQTIAVVMTHNYLDDLEILRSLLATPSRYIGLLGARQRTAKLLQDLVITPEQSQRLNAPIGLDIGAETPEEIAIAIIAEIQAVITDRPAGFLKQR
ncbi:XdhC/CoxI family protein, partial [Chamaesiphon sp. VAR_48_metabat_135_sub]|uniref:XdhC/CoxI family protein n=1 Tax=Chamaesiphon sp. VAR_48_metabat_135_sub TaxID=2964699 RepID=UPI00286D2D37